MVCSVNQDTNQRSNLFYEYSFVFICCIHFVIIQRGELQLVINVRDSGGDVLKEVFNANITEDLTEMTITYFDGVRVIHRIDFRNDLQIFHIIIPPELELSRQKEQILCFVTRFPKSEYISSDALSKLKQKNPGAIRKPDEILNEEIFVLDVHLLFPQSFTVSPQLQSLCSNARSTFSKESDIQSWITLRNDHKSKQLDLYSVFLSFNNLSNCSYELPSNVSCLCHFNVPIHWYPCGLKYCKSQDSNGKVINFRCGIKSCKKLRTFIYVETNDNCPWDV